MAVIHLNELPMETADRIWSTAQQGSAIASVADASPMKFGRVQTMTLGERPKAEFIGAGEAKSSSNMTLAPKILQPYKAQVTVRADIEVKWADEDHQLGVLDEAAKQCGIALSRALDFGAIHGVSPLQGTRYTPITEFATQAASVELGTSPATSGGVDGDMDAGFGAILANGYAPTGVAFDPRFGFTLARQRDAQGNLRNPGMGFGTAITAYQGLRAGMSSTVSGVPEIADTKVRAVIADFNTFTWGVQKQVGLELIEHGDPDGQGDLKRLNQIAFRMEVVYGWAWLDLKAVSVLKDAV